MAGVFYAMLPDIDGRQRLQADLKSGGQEAAGEKARGQAADESLGGDPHRSLSLPITAAARIGREAKSDSGPWQRPPRRSTTNSVAEDVERSI